MDHVQVACQASTSALQAVVDASPIAKSLAGDGYRIEVKRGRELSLVLRKAVLSLHERNIRSVREGSSIGYDADEVKDDHLHVDARLLLFFSKDSLAAYVLWRFDWDETAQDDVEVEVAYCYEMQVESSARGKNLGRRAMDLLCAVAREYAMQKVVLTVSKVNEDALRFYKRIGLTTDETDPANFAEAEPADYEILSIGVGTRLQESVVA